MRGALNGFKSPFPPSPLHGLHPSVGASDVGQGGNCCHSCDPWALPSRICFISLCLPRSDIVGSTLSFLGRMLNSDLGGSIP